MYIYETHAHTSPVSACARSSPAEQARAYKNRGYSGIIITDHFINNNATCPNGLPWDRRIEYFMSGYEEAKAAGDSIGLDVFFGWEYTIRGSDFLTYGLSLDFLLEHPELDYRMTVEQYSALIRSNGGYLAQAHPFREAYWIEVPFPVEPGLIDGVEVFNSGMTSQVNRQAFEFAQLHDLPIQAGSDSHDVRLRFASGIALSERAKSVSDIVEAIRTRRAELILPAEFLC